MRSQKDILIEASYQFYLRDDKKYWKEVLENAPGYPDWKPMNYDEYLDKVFSDNKDGFDEKFDGWFNEAKKEYFKGVNERIQNGYLRDGL